MKRRKQIVLNTFRRAFPYFLLVFLVGVFCYLCLNIHRISVPDSDFFLYVDEGRKFLFNPFAGIVTSPIYSVIVYLFERFLPIKYPGVTGGIIFNITCFTVSLYFVWLLSKRWMGWFAIIPLVLMAVNPLAIVVHLQPLNLPLATMLVLMAIYYDGKQPRLSYGLGIVAFFVRPEMAVIFVVIFIRDLAVQKRLAHPVLLLVAVVLIALWYFRPLTAPQNNDYLAEIIARRSEIPNVAFLRNSFAIAPFLTLSQDSINDAFNPLRPGADTNVIAALSLVWILCGVAYSYKNRLSQPLFIFGFVVFYSLIHVLFPDRVLRYSYPITPFVYMLLFWPVIMLNGHPARAQKIVSIGAVSIIFMVVILSVCLNGSSYIETQRWIKGEKRFAAEWFNAHVTSPTVVYAFEFWVSRYYTDNKNVLYADTENHRSWSNDLCTYTQNIYVVIDSQTEEKVYYFDSVGGINYFVRIHQSKEAPQYLLPITRITAGRRWAEIYEVDKTKEHWCEQLKSIAVKGI